MHGVNNNKPHNRPPFASAPLNLNDPMLQQVTIMALMSRPGVEKQLEEALNIIEGISNTIRIMRRGMESFHTSIIEAQRQMKSLPRAQGVGLTTKENVQQPQYMEYNALPLDGDNDLSNSK
ncbi:hypothetical protein V6C27_04355 [Peptococcaceae bacterium 1198_IL3148]